MAIRSCRRKTRRASTYGRGVRPAHSDLAMPVLVIPYPTFDPVLIQLGPFAIRWYALAYIFGILIGWAYARLLIRSTKLWGGKAPMTVVDFDDFVLWVTIGIILGGRIGYVLFYNLPLLRRAPDRNRTIVEWRHVISWRFHRLRARGFVVRLHARAFPFFRSVISPAQSDRSACSSAGSPISSMANCGAVPPTWPWAMIFPNGGPLPRHPSQLYEAALEGLLLLAVLGLLMRAGALKRPGLIIGCFRCRLRHRTHILRVLPRT